MINYSINRIQGLHVMETMIWNWAQESGMWNVTLVLNTKPACPKNSPTSLPPNLPRPITSPELPSILFPWHHTEAPHYKDARATAILTCQPNSINFHVGPNAIFRVDSENGTSTLLLLLHKATMPPCSRQTSLVSWIKICFPLKFWSCSWRWQFWIESLVK